MGVHAAARLALSAGGGLAGPRGLPRGSAGVPACRLMLTLALSLGAAALAIAAPAEAAPAAKDTIVVRDDRGTEHRFAAPPRRIVVLLPSLTEMVAALGSADRLVGVDRYSNWPPEALRGLPRLGGLDDAQIEAIAALRPDVVLAAHGARVTERLQALGFAVVMLKSDSHDDVRRSLALLARLLGRPETADALWAQMQQRIDAAAARVPPALRGRRAYFELGQGPWAAGEASFVGQTLARLGLGLANIVPAALGPFPQLNPEFVVRARPELTIGAAAAQARLAERPGWAALPAVQRRWQCALPPETYELVTRPGPRLGEAAEALADCLQRLPAP